jgi:hypothetical protein
MSSNNSEVEQHSSMKRTRGKLHGCMRIYPTFMHYYRNLFFSFVPFTFRLFRLFHFSTILAFLPLSSIQDFFFFINIYDIMFFTMFEGKRKCSCETSQILYSSGFYFLPFIILSRGGLKRSFHGYR